MPPILPTPIFQIFPKYPPPDLTPPQFFFLSCLLYSVGDCTTFDVLFFYLMTLWI